MNIRYNDNNIKKSSKSEGDIFFLKISFTTSWLFSILKKPFLQ